MPRARKKLELGKGAAFVKGRLKRLPQEGESWEADFRALPKPITQSETHYLGMVVAPDGSFLADSQVEGRPTVNDMATLLAHAMRRPLTGKAHRPRRLHVRGHHHPQVMRLALRGRLGQRLEVRLPGFVLLAQPLQECLGEGRTLAEPVLFLLPWHG